MRIFNFIVNGETLNTEKQFVTGKKLLELASLTPVEDYELLKKVNFKGFVPIQLDEKVDLTEPGIEHFSAKLYKALSILVNDQELKIDEYYSSPKKILELAGYNPEDNYLVQVKEGGVEISYKSLEDINHKLFIRSKSVFYVYPYQNNVSIKIDKEDFNVKPGKYSGKQLKSIGNVKNEYNLEQVTEQGIISIQECTIVDISGGEKFISLPRDGQSS